MPILSDKSKKIRQHTYDAGKATGDQAQIVSELEAKVIKTLTDELDYLQEKIAKDDEVALALKDERTQALHEYDLAKDKERTMIRGAMLAIHKEHDHFHEKHAASENNKPTPATGNGTTAAATAPVGA